MEGSPVSLNREESIITQFYDSRASTYDSEPDSFHPILAKDLIEIALPYLNSRDGDSNKILDLCCGTGMVTEAAVDVFGENTVVHGYDLSSVSISIARQKLSQRLPKADHVKFFQTSVASLPNAEQDLSFSAYTLAVCCSALVLIQGDLSQVIQSWSECLREGGLLIFDVPAEDENSLTTLFTRSLTPYNCMVSNGEKVGTKAAIRDLVMRSGCLHLEEVHERIYTSRQVHSTALEQKWERFIKLPLAGADIISRDDLAAAKASFLSMAKASLDDEGFLKDETRLYIAVARKTR